MIECGADSKLFEEVLRPLLQQGLSVRFQARGASMSPAIRDGEVVEVTPVMVTKLRKDDIVLAKTNHGFRLHRIVLVDRTMDRFITKGDCGQEDDPPLKGNQILGLAQSKAVRVGRNIVQARFRGVGGWMLRSAAWVQYVSGKWLARAGATSSVSILCLFLILFAVSLHAQVAVDSTTSNSATLAGAGSPTLTIAHTTAGTNRLMLVGVSINITNSSATTVTGVTWNATPLSLVGAHNDAGLTRRVEIWSLLAPATGAGTVTVTVNIPSAVNEGVVAGVTTFTGVDQTVPLGTFISDDGAGDTSSQLDVPSVINGMILDTLATGGNRTVNVPNPQLSQWNDNSSGSNNPGMRGVGTSRTGAPSVPISETFSGTSNWSLGAISINPSTADIGVSTNVSAVALGQNSTYNITIRNNGPSAANSVTLADTYNATNLSLVGYVPSAGTTCTNTATTINCTLPTPFVSGATATVAVTVSTSAPGFYPNTATITDSGTPPDPNTGNNTYVSLAPVVSVVCSNAVLSAGGTLSGVLNTYFPGTASVTAGATSIPIGASRGAGGTIANGSLLLVMQMQDATINTSNSVAYGNGSTGSGFTAINNAGNYEYVRATGPVSGGSVPIAGAGAGGGLVFGYTASAWSATKGASTYQVVLVPQYISATLGAATAAAWNGSTGGILALDIAGQLDLGGATASVDGLGFRGGAGMQFNGGVGGANTDYRVAGPATYGGTVQNGVDAPKGEGVAGTPKWVESGGTYLLSGTSYPSGTAGTDGSFAHGAPANGGGGGTDGNPPANDQNAGGGGGANGGSGGFGGDSWNTNVSSGGEGGSPFPATIDRVALGGGGGGGSRNNSDGDNQASSGAAGGGIIFIRANSFTGTGTLTANGAAAYDGTANDAGGGGGAGGSIIILARNGGESGLTLQANGGGGGDAWDSQAYSLAERHGPGGGGGGGVVYVSGAAASISVAGGANGTTLNPGVAYGATPGSSGTSATNATLGQVTGIQSASLCAPDLTLSKSHVGSFTRGASASYTIPVTNVSTLGATSGVVTLNDTLPIGMTPNSASGTGWTCSVTGQTVSCTRADSLGVGASYPAVTVNGTVLQSAPATVTNSAVIGGGGNANLLNDVATDVASVISSADMSVTDSGSPNPVATNGNVTYTQVVTNSGPSAADNATLVAPVPNSTTFVSMTAPAGWTCFTPGTGGTGNVVCTNSNMPGSSSGTFTLVVKVATGTTNGTVITDSVTVNSSVSDPVSSNNTATTTTIVGTSGPNLSVTNVASPNPVQANTNITYTQVVTNTGSSAITNGTFTEATPANTTFVSITPPAGWTCTGFPASPCTNPSVGAGTSGTFSVVYHVIAGTAAGTVVSDTATVNATNQSFGANSATATDVVTLATQADVALSTAATPMTVYAGNGITYTQTVTNNGPATANGVTFTEGTPTGTTFRSVLAPAGWSCVTPAVGGTGTITCTDASSFPNGSVADIVVDLNVPAAVAIGTITATSSVSAVTSDSNSANNTTTTTTTVNVACDLSVSNSGSPSPVLAGNTITYTQVVTNLGPSNCSTATLTEPTPANTTFVSVAAVTTGGGTWTCPNTAPVACANPGVVPGSTGTITAVYRVIAGTTAGTIISDTVTVGTTTRDTGSTNNSATVNIAVTSGTQADLSVTNTGSPNPVTAGNNITYTQSVTNGGPATANAPVFTETLPANTTAVSLTGPGGWTCVLATRTCTATAAMASGATANFTFVVQVNANVASGSTITQTDSVTSTTGDSNAGNNSATVNILVGDTSDLSVTNTPNPVPVIAGANITYTQVVTNNGPSTATSVTLTENLPANTSVVSLSGTAGWTCVPATRTCTNPSLAPSTSGTITYVLTVTAGTAAGTAINETASVTSAITDSNSANNSATAADVVALATQADLVVTNSAAPSSVAAGSNVTYTQTVTNKGPAAGTGVSITQTTPPNTNFQSITPPAGWTCGTVPPVGGTGTITCTLTGTQAVNNTASFTLVLQVNSGTPSGTNITDTVTANATNIVPSITTNTASATVVVANANSADVAIVKTATPNPVTQGTPLTYSLAVTNNGPASATNVTATDTLPSSVTYLSSTSTQGSCSEAGGTVTCLLGTMANAGTATVTILTIPQQPGIISNTATIVADQTDSNLANNSSTQNETVTAPTRVSLQSFSAHYGTDKNGANRVVLTWKTSGEAHNLGFNVYREQNGNRVRMNSSVIAGSALLMSGALPKHAGRRYAWIDPAAGVAGSSYWLEDIDVNGTRTMHGPVSVTGTQLGSDAPVAETRMMSQLSQTQPPAAAEQASHTLEWMPSAGTPTAGQIQKQFELAAHPAVKIFVRREGWYRVGQAELVKAGLDPNVDPAMLHLYAEGIEQPIKIIGAAAGPGGFGPQASINFYGTGIDTAFSGTRVYWLTQGEARGARIRQLPPSGGSNQAPESYSATVELRQQTIYFAALINSNDDNFFGALVSPTPVDQLVEVPHYDANSGETAQLEVSLQGVIIGFPHDVTVALNGTTIGDVVFTGQDTGILTVEIPTGVLQSWSNTVTLTAQNGDYDTSLVEYIRITYPHRYVADSNRLKFTARGGDGITVGNFTSAPMVVDITDPNRPVQLTPRVRSNGDKYEIGFQVPFTSTNSSRQEHTLLAVGDDRVATPPSVAPNHPSHWHSVQQGADIVMVTHGEFAGALAPLVRVHQAQGQTSAVIPVTDLYDEFNFGERSPFAIRRFLQTAKQNWKTPPSYLLLNGRASLDPRNYLGMGNLDLIPTRIVPTASLMTASDDWFSDFSNSGQPTIATGRLPVSTVDEATTVIGKISTYEGQSTNGNWTSNALFVADKDDTESFTQDAQTVQSRLPATVLVTDVFVDTVGTTAARSNITNAINSGQLLVNYIGHGSEEQWAGNDIFDTNTVSSLTNGSQLPVFLIMNCLNGFFQDVYSEPLGVTLMLASNGGAVAVVSSSGLNQPQPQTNLNAMVVHNAFAGKRQTLGDALVKAKSHIADPDVRRTFILFGDPAMQIKPPANASRP